MVTPQEVAVYASSTVIFLIWLPRNVTSAVCLHMAIDERAGDRDVRHRDGAVNEPKIMPALLAGELHSAQHGIPNAT